MKKLLLISNLSLLFLLLIVSFLFTQGNGVPCIEEVNEGSYNVQIFKILQS